ncbi:MAG: ATPase domain-containing protein [Candidatus Methylacidiphilales bacterium]|nr:ATPase domain-containing protein [Candidatus Methylacidiphilales bacterium]
MTKSPKLCATGIYGLDEILKGGLPANRLYLLRGNPGVGKTTLAMQFLLEGERQGENGLYVTLSETKEEIEDIALSHNWDLGKLAIFELSALEHQLQESAQNTIFHPSEIELNKTTELLLKMIEEANPRRVVLDSLSEFRLLSDSSLRYRRQMLALKQYFAGREITVLLLDDHAGGNDLQVQSIAHGVISLETITSEYGSERKRVKVDKLRGVNFLGGYHDTVIFPGGLTVYPRLVARDHSSNFHQGLLSSGIKHLDELLGGGLDWGTSCLFLGPAGCGKSSLANQFAVSAAAKDHKVLILLFEESRSIALARANGIGSDLEAQIAAGKVELRQLDPGELAPGQFVNMITDAVEKDGVRVLLIDSLNGYLQAMPGIKYLNIQLHELLAFLNNRGVLTMVTVAQQGIMGSGMTTPVDMTYLADTVLLLRYFEQEGQIKRAVSILKKRIGHHETTIRQIQTNSHGIQVGEVLSEFHGVLSGTPVFTGDRRSILKQQ